MLKRSPEEQAADEVMVAPIPGFSDYIALSDGRIVNLVHRLRGGHYKRRWYEMRGHSNHRGYIRMRLTGDDGKPRSIFAHVLIALAFLGDRPTEDHEVNHKNGDRADNSVENLEWVTRSENMKHAWVTGLRTEVTLKPKKNAEGFSANARLTAQQASEIRKSKKSNSTLAKEYGVDRSTISRIKTGKLYKEAV